MARPILTILDNNDKNEPFKTVPIDTYSRRFVHITLKNIFKKYENGKEIVDV